MNVIPAMQPPSPKLALGPLPYFWPAESVFDFYARVADSPVEIVYLGETVCAKRRLLRGADWLDIARRLHAAGKEIVLSTLTLIEADSELQQLERLCAQDQFLVEANDIAAVQARAGRPFVGGATLNLYNTQSLRRLHAAGMRRWVMPVELSAATLAELQAQRPAGLETEVFAFGRLPLAYSARCFTARAYNLPKDDCQFRCLDDADGLALQTRDKSAFLTLNGIQTQSALVYDLSESVGELRGLGVDVVRLSPQSTNMPAIIASFRERCAGRSGTPLEGLRVAPPCNGYWHGVPGMEYRT